MLDRLKAGDLIGMKFADAPKNNHPAAWRGAGATTPGGTPDWFLRIPAQTRSDNGDTSYLGGWARERDQGAGTAGSKRAVHQRAGGGPLTGQLTATDRADLLMDPHEVLSRIPLVQRLLPSLDSQILWLR